MHAPDVTHEGVRCEACIVVPVEIIHIHAVGRIAFEPNTRGVTVRRAIARVEARHQPRRGCRPEPSDLHRARRWVNDNLHLQVTSDSEWAKPSWRGSENSGGDIASGHHEGAALTPEPHLIVCTILQDEAHSASTALGVQYVEVDEERVGMHAARKIHRLEKPCRDALVAENEKAARAATKAKMGIGGSYEILR